MRSITLILLIQLLFVSASMAADLVTTIQRVKPSVVAVGTHIPLAGQNRPRGTGFVVGRSYVITNAHVVPTNLDHGRREQLAVFLPVKGGGKKARWIAATEVQRDTLHDLSVLKLSKAKLPSMRLGNEKDVREGEVHAFTGYPLGNALGLYPITHQGIISAIAPNVIPVASGKQLNPDMIGRLSQPYNIFQLDAVAYPGGSGSPLYEPDTGRVIGVIASVRTKKSKESAIKDPSGITYVIPVTHVRALLKKAGVGF